ncbi:polymer-forming cytoskeletal protein [Rhodobacteraceae bacterium W635]|uniref:bactofilin family protein n=1 Tax=Nioella halotolerans TaxID=2303578 RepID=UPI000E3D615F|nr:polymer-forming cytoskeletal protein [Rhodobacteraceae bacterium W635]
MFSKSKINEPGQKAAGGTDVKSETAADAAQAGTTDKSSMPLTNNSKAKAPASVLSTDLTITGNLRTTGDIQVEGTVQGDIRAHLLTVGEGATIEGEIVADDIVVTGRVVGKVRGLKVRLTSTARVEGDIIHKTIAIESGAHFEGSVQRQEDPLSSAGTKKDAAGGGKQGAQQQAAAKPQPAAQGNGQREG